MVGSKGQKEESRIRWSTEEKQIREIGGEKWNQREMTR